MGNKSSHSPRVETIPYNGLQKQHKSYQSYVTRSDAYSDYEVDSELKICFVGGSRTGKTKLFNLQTDRRKDIYFDPSERISQASIMWCHPKKLRHAIRLNIVDIPSNPRSLDSARECIQSANIVFLFYKEYEFGILSKYLESFQIGKYITSSTIVVLINDAGQKDLKIASIVINIERITIQREYTFDFYNKNNFNLMMRDIMATYHKNCF